jgi:hypothetical protein
VRFDYEAATVEDQYGVDHSIRAAPARTQLVLDALRLSLPGKNE